MSYQVIARKWRSQTFDDVVGQDHVVRTLKNSIARNRVGHAYLFVGPRGTGKTSTARIFAKVLNCTGTGRGLTSRRTIPAVQAIAAGTHLDVIEIDGASNNGVEQVRDLRETARYSPAQGKFKIYIIDEVHMLSSVAFNAAAQNARGAAGAREIHLRHDRCAEGAAHDPFALPALRSQSHPPRTDRGAAAADRPGGKNRNRRGRACEHRATCRRRDARRAVDFRPDDFFVLRRRGRSPRSICWMSMGWSPRTRSPNWRGRSLPATTGK